MITRVEVKPGMIFNCWEVLEKGKDVQRFKKNKKGKLTVYARRIKWICKCLKCNVLYTIDSYHLRKGNSKQCRSCSIKERMKNASWSFKKRPFREPEKILETYYKEVRNSALSKRRGIEFSITFEDFRKIVYLNCVYCGEPPRIRKLGFREIAVSSIDRINSNGHYTVDNCQPTCSICNIMKSVHSQQVFLEHIKKIVKFLGDK